MKRLKILSIMTGFLLILSTIVLASEPQVSISGENTAKPGETKTVVVSVSNEDKEIGVVSGTIEKTSNITSISVSGKNGWNLTYNAQTGVFNIYKAEGAKAEEVMSIEYTTSNEEGTAQVVLRGTKTTTIDYETIDIGDITKIITIKNATTEPEEDGGNDGENTGNTNDGENAGNTNDGENTGNTNDGENTGNTNDGENTGNTNDGENTGNTNDGENTGNTNDGENTGNTNDGENTGNTNDAENTANTNNAGNTANTNKNTTNSSNTKKDNTTSNGKKIPQTGGISSTIILISIMLIISVISYRNFKNYKNI